MRVTRIFSDEDGGSHFQEMGGASIDEWMVDNNAQIAIASMSFNEDASQVDPRGWHCAPVRLFVVLLEGCVEVEVSDGEIRRFKAGDVILADDLVGQGHLTTRLGPSAKKSLYIPLV